MVRRRTTLRLSPHEDASLKHLYLQRRVAVDRYADRPRDLKDLTDEFNVGNGRDDSPEEILHYMRTKRKNGQWVTFDGTHRRLRSVVDGKLSPEDWDALDQMYLDLGVGGDNFGYDPTLLKSLADMFAERTGRRLSGRVLAAAIEMRRKNGNLPTLYLSSDDDIGFTDIDEVSA